MTTPTNALGKNGSTRRVSRFEGPVSGRDVALLASLALSNAKELIEEARLLFQNAGYSRVIALAVMAIEETAKWFIVQDGFIKTPDGKWKEFWFEVRNHPTKLRQYRHSRYMEEMKTLYANPSGWANVVSEIESEPDLRELREGCLYVDHDGKEVVSPRKHHNQKAEAERILNQAGHFLGSVRQPLPPLDQWGEHLEALRAKV